MYMMNIDGSGLTKISRDNGFDAFPMFSPNGKKLIFSSNRNNGGTRDTNLFIVDWVKYLPIQISDIRREFNIKENVYYKKIEGVN
jgi:Tol biopolymer transport system component